MPRKNILTHADFVRVEKAGLRRERGSLFILSFGTLPVHRCASQPDAPVCRRISRFRGLAGTSPSDVQGQKIPETKTSCVVSKKTAARAVDRNLIKRRWRDAMLQCLSAVPAPSILVFYAMKPANGASFKDIKSDVSALVARAGAKLRAS
ncbi:MAG: ribonuclease P protein component [bacterium]|nr:ribonuclease P protein component [bacterium]